ncbi:uncharacterized protein LOC126821291 [Patella vulgata]|uniref:uncharacterized protein LOC126821291 n=1 Tax=Patella vulgata TaxID=6465 RepID=UPI00217F6459|nr:uncharacterized protein LOC126821291 [Patella vulgata]
MDGRLNPEAPIKMDGYLNPQVINYEASELPRQNSTNHTPDTARQQHNYANDDARRNESAMPANGGYLHAKATNYAVDNHKPQPQPRTRTKMRFDSGVGDLEMHRVSGLSPTRSSMSYEYVDNVNHYEEVPTLDNRLPTPVVPPAVPEPLSQRSPDSQTTITSAQTEVTSDTDDRATVFRSRSTNSKRKKISNPLYSRMISAASNIFADQKHNESTKKIDSLEHQVSCQCLVILILFIVTLGATALCIYLMIAHSDSFISNNELLVRIQKLEEANMKLYQSSALKTNNSVFESNLNQINVNQQQLEFTYKNLTSQITSINNDLQQQIYNVSKMPGPPGVGNLSACFYSNSTATSTGSDAIASETSWKPELAKLTDYVVMSAFCTVTGGTRYELEVLVHAPNSVQYNCRCYGAVSGKAYRYCVVHYVLCPRYS